MDALLTAFQDTMTHGVVLVTDDICDQDPFSLINQVSQVARGRPVHCIYITTSGMSRGERDDEDQAAIQFLQNLSTVTRGSFKIVSIGRFGIDKITPVSSPSDLCTVYQLANLTRASLNLNEGSSGNSTINGIVDVKNS